VDFRRIEPKKLYLRIADQILERVGDGRLPPGTKLPSERELASQMGVSRPSVREAFIALELLGVVEIRIGQGTFVVGRPASLETLSLSGMASPFDLLEARSTIESNVVVLVARKWQDGTIDERAFKRTYEIGEQMKRIVGDEDRVEDFYGLGLAFHEALAEASNNEVLSKVVGNLVEATSHPLWALINRKILESRSAREEQIREHEVVLEAIQRGDGEAAARAMRHHIEELKGLVLG
jgi:GntR family transcriptional repressor for pyruvate dehydrogenase complex